MCGNAIHFAEETDIGTILKTILCTISKHTVYDIIQLIRQECSTITINQLPLLLEILYTSFSMHSILVKSYVDICIANINSLTTFDFLVILTILNTSFHKSKIFQLLITLLFPLNNKNFELLVTCYLDYKDILQPYSNSLLLIIEHLILNLIKFPLTFPYLRQLITYYFIYYPLQNTKLISMLISFCGNNITTVVKKDTNHSYKTVIASIGFYVSEIIYFISINYRNELNCYLHLLEQLIQQTDNYCNDVFENIIKTLIELSITNENVIQLLLLFTQKQLFTTNINYLNKGLISSVLLVTSSNLLNEKDNTIIITWLQRLYFTLPLNTKYLFWKIMYKSITNKNNYNSTNCISNYVIFQSIYNDLLAPEYLHFNLFISCNSSLSFDVAFNKTELLKYLKINAIKFNCNLNNLANYYKNNYIENRNNNINNNLTSNDNSLDSFSNFLIEFTKSYLFFQFKNQNKQIIDFITDYSSIGFTVVTDCTKIENTIDNLYCYYFGYLISVTLINSLFIIYQLQDNESTIELNHQLLYNHLYYLFHSVSLFKLNISNSMNDLSSLVNNNSTISIVNNTNLTKLLQLQYSNLKLSIEQLPTISIDLLSIFYTYLPYSIDTNDNSTIAIEDNIEYDFIKEYYEIILKERMILMEQRHVPCCYLLLNFTIYNIQQSLNQFYYNLNCNWSNDKLIEFIIQNNVFKRMVGLCVPLLQSLAKQRNNNKVNRKQEIIEKTKIVLYNYICIDILINITNNTKYTIPLLSIIVESLNINNDNNNQYNDISSYYEICYSYFYEQLIQVEDISIGIVLIDILYSLTRNLKKSKEVINLYVNHIVIPVFSSHNVQLLYSILTTSTFNINTVTINNNNVNIQLFSIQYIYNVLIENCDNVTIQTFTIQLLQQIKYLIEEQIEFEWNLITVDDVDKITKYVIKIIKDIMNGNNNNKDVENDILFIIPIMDIMIRLYVSDLKTTNLISTETSIQFIKFSTNMMSIFRNFIINAPIDVDRRFYIKIKELIISYDNCTPLFKNYYHSKQQFTLLQSLPKLMYITDELIDSLRGLTAPIDDNNSELNLVNKSDLESSSSMENNPWLQLPKQSKQNVRNEDNESVESEDMEFVANYYQ